MASCITQHILETVLANPNAHQPTGEILVRHCKAQVATHNTIEALSTLYVTFFNVTTSRTLAAMPSVRSKPTSLRDGTAQGEKVKYAQSQSASPINSSFNGELEISGDDLRRLRHVPKKIPISAYSIALFEMFESFLSSGTFIVCTLLRSFLLVLA
jgi:hypothetical protein